MTQLLSPLVTGVSIVAARLLDGSHSNRNQVIEDALHKQSNKVFNLLEQFINSMNYSMNKVSNTTERITNTLQEISLVRNDRLEKLIRV